MSQKGLVLVSGCAGRLGQAVTQHLLGTGYSVIGLDKRPLEHSLLESTKSQHFAFFEGDATSPSQVRNAIEYGEESLGPLKGAVHAAYPTSPDWGTHLEDLDETSLAFNLHAQLGGTLFFARECSARLTRNGGGSIVLISSILGVRAPKFNHYAGLEMSAPAEYSAIKGGVISLARWFAAYNKGNDVRVNAVSPGGIKSGQHESFSENYRHSCLSKGLLDAEDVAGSIEFLLSDRSKFISGQNLIVDDGWTLS